MHFLCNISRASSLLKAFKLINAQTKWSGDRAVALATAHSAVFQSPEESYFTCRFSACPTHFCWLSAKSFLLQSDRDKRVEEKGKGLARRGGP